MGIKALYLLFFTSMEGCISIRSEHIDNGVFRWSSGSNTSIEV